MGKRLRQLHEELLYNITDIKRILPFTLIAVGTLLLDMAALYIGVSILGYSYLWVLIIAFFFFEAVNYVLVRAVVFHETRREWVEGLARFIVFSIIAAVFTVLIVAFFVEVTNINYLVARFIAGATVGLLGYLYNLHFNFELGWRDE